LRSSHSVRGGASSTGAYSPLVDDADEGTAKVAAEASGGLLNGLRATTALLCADDMRRPLAMGIGIMLFQQFSGINAVIFYSGSILETAGMEDANLGGALIMAVQVLLTGVSMVLMDKAGRKVLLGLSATGMAASGLALAVFFVNGKKPTWLALMSLMTYIATFSLGMGPVPWLFMGEIFPANARALACSVATLANWSFSFLVTYYFNRVQALLKPQGCFVVFAGVCLGAAGFATCVMPETKGKTFEMIAREFRKADPPPKEGQERRSESSEF